ncbi:hypothetical protein ACLOJK_037944 [Asimina triloba]
MQWAMALSPNIVVKVSKSFFPLEVVMVVLILLLLDPSQEAHLIFLLQQSHVPKFGDWESEENVPYTAYFEKARKGKTGGKMINPNDPEENPDAFSDDVPTSPLRSTSDPKIPSPAMTEAVASKHKHERRPSREDGELRQQSNSPASRHDSGARRGSTDSPHHRYGERGVNSSETPRKGNRTGGGSDRGIEHSPLHPNHQARLTSKGGVSPSWERRGSSEGFAPHTPGRSKLRNPRGDETPERSAAVPKFGDWDETDPASADGYTHIFNQVREEKQIGSAKVPGMHTETSYYNNQRQDNLRKSESTVGSLLSFMFFFFFGSKWQSLVAVVNAIMVQKHL